MRSNRSFDTDTALASPLLTGVFDSVFILGKQRRRMGGYVAFT